MRGILGEAVVAERFAIEREAGAGGMGTVFRARDRLGGGAVALKVLRGGDPIDIERFTREAAVLASLSHPGIVRYVAHGKNAAGEHYIAMEWLDGEDLSDRLARRALSVAESVTLMRRAADALAVMHARGLVHRDIKPSNLFLVGGDVERLKLVDFGIAQISPDARLTRTGVLLGTPGYMAPEQIHTPSAQDRRADVFALGCVFFECLTGRRAFEGQHAMAVLAKVLLHEPPRVRELRPEVAPAIDAIVARMLAKAPEERPGHGAAVAAELARIDDRELAPPASLERVVSPGAIAPRTLDSPANLVPPSLTLDEQRLVTLVLAGDAHAGDAPPDAGMRAAELQAAVDPYGGRLHALARGSLVVTLWGDGTALDRAHRAARCALALKARYGGLPICVVTGRGLVSARRIEGDVLDRGVRALARAPRGAVTVDDATAAMLGASFEIEEADGARRLRGERASREGAPLLLGKPTPYVGRSRELSILEGVFSGCVYEGVASAVLVTGPAGAGKSRLCREFLQRVRQRDQPVEILLGRGDPLCASPFGILADALRRAAGIDGGEPMDVRREKLSAWLRRSAGAAPRLAGLAPFLGEIAQVPFPDDGDDALRAARGSPPLMSDATRAAWQDWLTDACAVRPVVIVLEDLHWGDAATARLVDATLRSLRDLPLMVIALARPEVHANLPGLWSEREVQTIRLGPLPRRASERLAQDALGPAVPAEIVARIVDHADGNPFFLEELVRAVAAGREDALPESVLGTVEARLDLEGGEAKRILRAGSVFGDCFTRAGVEALLAGALRPSRIAECLEGLVERELVIQVSAPGDGEDVHYAYRHSLVRETVYATLTEADRALGHRLAGAWLERGAHVDALVLAEHFRLGDEGARAARCYRRAAEQALDASDLGAALERAGRGVECGAEGQELGALRLVEAEARLWRGDLTLAERHAVEAAGLLGAASPAWFRALTQAVVSAGKLGRYDEVERWARAADEADAPRAAGSAQLICLSECASYLTFGGRYAAADAVLERLRRDTADPAALERRVAALIHQSFAIRASCSGDPAGCLEGFHAALAAFEQAGDHRNACAVRSNLGFVLAELGDFQAAEDALRTALAAAGRMGLHELETAVLQNLGRVLAYRGRLEEARATEQRAAEVFRRLGDPRMEGVSRTYLAEIALFAGDLALAEQDARAAAALLEVAPPMRATASAVLARVLLRRGCVAEAGHAAREASAILDALGALEEGESIVRLVHAEALAAAGERQAFASAIASARARLLERAAKISDPAWRDRFLTAVPDNARTLAIAADAGAPPPQRAVC